MRRALLITTTLLAAWLGMQAFHEMGHVLGAIASDGRVARVVLHPLTISRTDLAENPHPLFVSWAGPVGGVLLPALAWQVAARCGLSSAFLFRFFAGFCLLANGLYLGCGSFERVGDCGDLLRHGTPIWLLWLFGLACAPAGLGLWHRQGAHFGLGPAPLPIASKHLWATSAACVALVLVGLMAGR